MHTHTPTHFPSNISINVFLLDLLEKVIAIKQVINIKLCFSKTVVEYILIKRELELRACISLNDFKYL